jgi:Protein of unknown function (DUF1549)/Protein of unknown function (DUF1553)
MRRSFQIPVAGLAIFALLMPTSIIGQETNEFRSAPTAADCTFLRNPDQFLKSHELHRAEVSKWTESVRSRSRDGEVRVVMPAEGAPATTPRKNFIDDYIFGRMEKDGVKPAPMSSDFEFLRRVTLDLTGRIPTLQDLYAFAGDPNPNKREQVIDKLVWSYEFLDKWTMFFGDLYKNSVTGVNVTRYQQGRDAFHDFVYSSLAVNKPYDQMVREMITGEGDNFVNGATNWLVGTTIAMGPAQDTYDGGAVHAAQMFLGVSTVDCLLCHDGARHLDSLNVWARDEKRINMQGLAAFFARTRMTRTPIPQTNYAKWLVSQTATGDYMLNTNSGNRQPRTPVNGSNRVMPKYPWNGAAAIPADANRLQALASTLTSDIQFSRATVNYIWEKFMVEAFVSPSNQFDLARLDPKNPPPAPWTLQPTNPELLNAMAEWFQQSGYNIRLLMMTIAKSNAYQLSSDYPGEWKLDYVPYYARKFVRRLDAEEIHDAIVQATWILPSYTMDYAGSLSPLPAVSWAMKFPDPTEPRSNNNTVTFLNAFGRGNRDQTPRDSSASVLQALNLMNHTFVMNRIHANNTGSNVQWVDVVTAAHIWRTRNRPGSHAVARNSARRRIDPVGAAEQTGIHF